MNFISRAALSVSPLDYYIWKNNNYHQMHTDNLCYTLPKYYNCIIECTSQCNNITLNIYLKTEKKFLHVLIWTVNICHAAKILNNVYDKQKMNVFVFLCFGVEYFGTFCSVLFGFRKCNVINDIADPLRIPEISVTIP